MKKNIILIFAIMLVVCLGGCSFSFDGSGNTSTTSDNPASNVNMQFYNAAQKIIVNDLFEMVSVGRCGVSNDLDFSNSNKLSLNNLTDTYKYSMAYYVLYKNLYTESFAKNSISFAYKKIFGVEPVLPNRIDIYQGFDSYELNSEFDTYNVVAGGGGCAGFRTYYILDSYDLVGDTISINAIYYIKSADLPLENPISYVKNKEEKDDSYFEFEASVLGDFAKASEIDEAKVKENKDKFTQYRFNFKLSEDHYIFDSIEKIN